jgi:hypothetical protein
MTVRWIVTKSERETVGKGRHAGKNSLSLLTISDKGLYHGR